MNCQNGTHRIDQDERAQPETTQDTLVCCLTNDLPEPRRTEAILFTATAWKSDRPTGAAAIGFLPWDAYTHRDICGELLVLYRNQDLVAFCMLSKVSPFQELRCLQIWVRPDARMIEHGRALIRKLDDIAHQRGAITMRLWCAEDLAANLFWHQLGFEYRGWRWGQHKRARRHLLWSRPVGTPLDRPVTADPPPELTPSRLVAQLLA
jgi:GNAT superfamily N-acetyltransferase